LYPEFLNEYIFRQIQMESSQANVPDAIRAMPAPKVKSKANASDKTNARPSQGASNDTPLKPVHKPQLKPDAFDFQVEPPYVWHFQILL
jgi:hypothetical protein